MTIQIIKTSPSANVGSVIASLNQIGMTHKIVGRSSELRLNEPVLIPGVGTFRRAMQNLDAGGFVDALTTHSGRQAPIVGICLGMQILTHSGQEGGPSSGMGLLQGVTKSFAEESGSNSALHIGVREAVGSRSGGIPGSSRFYFAHSFYVSDWSPEEAVSTSRFRGIKFPAQLEREGVTGFQFHPELSGATGLSLLKAALS